MEALLKEESNGLVSGADINFNHSYELCQCFALRIDFAKAYTVSCWNICPIHCDVNDNSGV